MGQQIHWFPGHMQKALREIDEKIKLVDIVIEVLDSRAPFSSINEEIEKRIVNKKRLIVLAKSDLADPTYTPIFKKKLQDIYGEVLVLNLTDNNAGAIISKSIAKLGQEKQQKEIAKGMKPQPLRTMILGIPNVGKSSLINRLAKRKAAGVQNKPGFTRGEQWIKVDNNFLLLDTPGILPMNYENKKKAINLALIGAVKEDILPNEDLSKELVTFLNNYYPGALKARFSISDLSNFETVINGVCNNRKLLTNDEQKDYERAYILLLKEFKDGKLGRFTLER